MKITLPMVFTKIVLAGRSQRLRSTALTMGFLVILCSLFSSCDKEGDKISPNKTFAADSVTVGNVSYNNYIYALLKKNCGTCHGESGSARTWWLNTHTYENAKENYRLIIGTMVNGTMPPPPKFPFTEKDRALLKAWIDRGLPQN